MENNKTGAFIKTLRTEMGITQKELADKLGVTDKAVSRWETGKGLPEVSFLIPLANELGISVNELLTGERIEEEKLIDNSNEIIVETIKTSNKTISKLSIIISAVFLIFQIALFYGIPLAAEPGDEMGIVFLFVIGTCINSVSMGFLKSKYKFLTPLTASVLFIPFELLNSFDGEETLLYTLIFFAAALLGMLPGIFFNLIAKLIKKRKAADAASL